MKLANIYARYFIRQAKSEPERTMVSFEFIKTRTEVMMTQVAMQKMAYIIVLFLADTSREVVMLKGHIEPIMKMSQMAVSRSILSMVEESTGGMLGEAWV